LKKYVVVEVDKKKYHCYLGLVFQEKEINFTLQGSVFFS